VLSPPDVRLTRRRAIELAGAATAAAALRPAEARAASFSVAVPLPAGATAASGLRTLPPVRPGAPFDLIGLDFGRAAHVHAEVRARRAGGAWTPWAAVHAPTQPCWTGAADEFQVRFRGAARRLRARLVRTGPAPRARAVAKASAGQPAIIPRSGWGGHRLPPRERPAYGEVQVAFVHHTVTANTYGPEDSAGIVLGICRYHRDHNGWSDIGYNFLVDRYGQVFEGRAGGIRSAVVGAQAQGYNSHSTGVSCIGDFTSSRLTPGGVEAVAQLLAWKLSVHRVPATGTATVVSQGGSSNRYRAGTRVTLNRICGHRDGDATSCPGEALYDQLPTIRRRAAALQRDLGQLTLDVDTTELYHPETVVAILGTLRLPDGAPPGGAEVQIQYQPESGAAWTLLETLAAEDDGAYSTAVSLPATGWLRAVHPGAGRGPITAAPVLVEVHPALTLRLDPPEVVTGERVAITGTVDPPGATTAEVIVHRWRPDGRRKLVWRTDVPVVDGVVETSFKAWRSGRYRVTMRAGGSTIRRNAQAI
jgi:hypothetical protein